MEQILGCFAANAPSRFIPVSAVYRDHIASIARYVGLVAARR
jgi:hypothetical protein